MEAGFRAGRYADAVIAGIARISSLLTYHFPTEASPLNELPNEPVTRP
jgi:uncharacterized membrane protein